MVALRTINVVAMVILPILISAYSIKRYKGSWKIWGIGGLIFVISQVGHIPFNYFAGKILNNTSLIFMDTNQQLVFNALFLGLSAGIWEESSRYLGYLYWLKKPKKWSKGIIIGLGHGSFESILIGVIAIYVLLQMAAFKNTDLSNIVPIDKLEFTYQTVQQYWNVNWYDTLLGPLERLFTIPLQVLLTLLIIQIFKKNNIIWLALAILVHSGIDAAAVLLISLTNVYITEVFIAIISIISIFLVIKLKTNDDEIINFIDNPEPLKATKSITVEMDDSMLDIDETKFY
jgi:uncharacterized membrane protein YhfC